MIDLKMILQQHPNCLNSRASFKSVLMDKYPTERRMVNILTILFECGVANKIKIKRSIDANEIQGLIAQIENEYGISGRYSQDAILTWASAFDVTAFAVKTDSPPNISNEVAPSTEPKPVEYVQGDVDDYDIVQKSDGYYITHFNGFEEENMVVPSLIAGKKIIGIAQDAFKGCVMVKHVSISKGIEIIENCAFKDCKALEIVDLPTTMRKIGSQSSEYGIGAFQYTGLKSITVPPSVDFIGPCTFQGCFHLRKATLPDGIKTICRDTFDYCSELATIDLPRGLQKIEKNAFKECKQLTEIRIPVGTQIIEEDAFAKTSLTTVYIPPTVVQIGCQDPNSFTVRMMGDGTFGYNAFRKTLTIYCTAGSTAMEYARKNNFKCAKAQF